MMTSANCIDYWYSINGDAGSYGGATWAVTPCHRIPGDDANVIPPENFLCKFSQITDPAELAFFFDGVWTNCYNGVYRINARHGNRLTTNVSFFDGHCENLPRASLPGAHGDSGSEFSLSNLTKNYPYPHWRLDQ
jgi:prepilin-type processing-associated H-X9-DG protein